MYVPAVGMIYTPPILIVMLVDGKLKVRKGRLASEKPRKKRKRKNKNREKNGKKM
jgi:hypothetical protein